MVSYFMLKDTDDDGTTSDNRGRIGDYRGGIGDARDLSQSDLLSDL